MARCQAITTALELFKLQSIRVLLRRLLFNVHLSCLSSIDVVTFFELTKNLRQQVFRLTLVFHKWLLWFSLSNTRSTSLSTLSPKIYNAADDASAHALTKVAMIWRKWAHAFLYIRTAVHCGKNFYSNKYVYRVFLVLEIALFGRKNYADFCEFLLAITYSFMKYFHHAKRSCYMYIFYVLHTLKSTVIHKIILTFFKVV